MKALLSSTYFGPVQWYQKLNRCDECLIERHESFIKQTYRNRMVIATTNGPLSLTIPTNHDTSMAMKDIRISDHANWRHVHWNALLSAYGESPFFEYYQDDIRPFFEKKYDFLFDFNMEITEKMIELLDIRPHIKVTDEYFPKGRDLRVKSEEFNSLTGVKGEGSEELRVKSEEFNGLNGVKGEGSEELRVKSEEFNGLNGVKSEEANHKVQSSNLKVQSSLVQSSNLKVQSSLVQSSNLKVQSIVDFRDAIRPKHPLHDPDFTPKRYYQVYEQKFGFQPNLSILDLLFNEGNEAIFYL